MDTNKAQMELAKKFDNMVKSNIPLADLNTFRTGGKARLLAEVTSTQELSDLVKETSDLGIPFFMLGGGSNVLISDSGYEGLIIKNDIKGIEANENIIDCGAGEDLQDLINFASENSLTGLEFAAGIYGTVGGAIYGNAGAYGAEICDILVSAELVDRHGNIRTEEKSYFSFAYRSSKLKETRELVARATFCLKIGQKDKIKGKVKEILAIRKEKLPIDKPTAGCFFKNIPDKTREYGKLSAGKLLDEIGAKQMYLGEAAVFSKHANILINNGSATSSDIRRLSLLLKKKVKEKFDIELKEEITLLGKFEEEAI